MEPVLMGRPRRSGSGMGHGHPFPAPSGIILNVSVLTWEAVNPHVNQLS